MQVNVCPRLIEKMIRKGVIFVGGSYGGDDSSVYASFIPLGVYSTKNYQINEVVHVLSGKLLTSPTRESIHIGNDHVTREKSASLLGIKFDDNQQWKSQIFGKNTQPWWLGGRALAS